MKRKIILLVQIFMTGLVAGEIDSQLDSISAFYTKNTPAVSVAIYNKGDVIKKAYGMASLELKVPATTKSVYRIGSLSKQMTAAAIVILEQEGKLSVSDKIIDYFPQLPADVYGKVTIGQMIFHTSGIRDIEAMFPLMGIDYSRWFTHDMLLEALTRQKALCFPAGSQYEYSNSAYVLLALIVEKVTGENFEDFLQENIFDPLDMVHTYLQTSPETFIPNRTAGYKLVDGKYVNWMTNNQLLGHDAVYSSVEDMLLWQKAVMNGKLGKYDLSRMTTPGKFNNGTAGNYGYGLVMGKYRGLDYFCHDGWYVGYKAFIITFPKQDFGVVALSNLGNKSVRGYSLKIVDFFLKDYFVKNSTQTIVESPDFSVIAKTDTLARLDLGRFYEVNSIKHYITSPYEKGEFCSPDHQVRLKILNDKDGIKLQQTTSYGSKNLYVPFQYQPISAEEKKQLIGHYFSSELDNDARILNKKGKLYIQLGLTEQQLYKFCDNQYMTPESSITITKKSRKKIKEFIFSTYGVQNVVFEKIK